MAQFKKNPEGGIDIAYSWIDILPFFKKIAELQLFDAYYKLVEPLFVFQKNEQDDLAVARKKHYQNMLSASGNPLYESGLLIVHVLLWKELDYCETFEEYQQKCIDFKKDELQRWSRNITDNEWKQVYLFNQVF